MNDKTMAAAIAFLSNRVATYRMSLAQEIKAQPLWYLHYKTQMAGHEQALRYSGFSEESLGVDSIAIALPDMIETAVSN